MPTDYKNLLCALVNASTAADDSAIENAVAKFKDDFTGAVDSAAAEVANAKSEANGANLALENTKKALVAAQAQIGTLATELANRDADRFASLITNRDAVVQQLIANRSGTLAFLEAIRTPASAPAIANANVNAKVEQRVVPIHNRAEAGLPAPVENGGSSATSEEFAKLVANRATELRAKDPRLSFAKSFANARVQLASAK